MTHSLIKFRLIRQIYLVLGISYAVGLIAINVWFSFIKLNWSYWNILWFILLLLAAGFIFIVSGLATGLSKDKSVHSAFVGMMTLMNNTKFIYHDKLGYFIINIKLGPIEHWGFTNTIDICKQTLFAQTEIITGITYTDKCSLDKISENIKRNLDNYYQSILNQKQKEQQQKALLKRQQDNINRVMGWDGYLDKTTKRDKNISKII